MKEIVMEAEKPEPIESVDNRQFDELHSQELNGKIKMKLLCPKCQQEFNVKRSVQQNKYLHKVFSIIAEHTGYSLNEIKTLMKHEFGFYEEVVNKKTGETLINYLSTADLNKKDFADFTEKIVMFANSHGLKVLSPEEYFET